MAFQQPQHRPQASRQFPISQPETRIDTAAAAQLQRKRTLDESEEWVLFSPQPPSATDRTHTTSTERTPRTAGLSRLSDFGSLDTAARSQEQEDDDDDDNITCQGTEIEDDGELDSLDDGLHAFHEPFDYARHRLDQSGGTVLPTHDGLGTFQASSASVQNQLWQFERYNSRRPKHRRRSSVQRQLDRLEEEDDRSAQDNERTRRIEKWRVEQSIALLEEIERETRRIRRMSRATVARPRAGSLTSQAATEQSSMPGTFPEVVRDTSSAAPEETPEQESFWARFTRRVIRDLMGIDETMLSVIFGEELPDEAKVAIREDTSTAGEMAIDTEKSSSADVPSEPWEYRVLGRIARELGILVHQLSEHPGAFSTYLRTQEAPSYASFPKISTSAIQEDSPEVGNSLHPTTPGGFASSSAPVATPGGNVFFAPTVPHKPTNIYNEASLWGIEEEPDYEGDAPMHAAGAADEAARLRRDTEYWERELDVKMVFNFLKQRFSSRPASPEPTGRPRAARFHAVHGSAAQAAAPAGPSASIASARRAALIRQHHPLVGSASDEASRQQSKRRELMNKQYQYGIPHHMRSGSRSASVSVSVKSHTSGRKSRRSASAGASSVSRNFWDAGASQVGSANGLGMWGEV